jgi:hypothetical protein
VIQSLLIHARKVRLLVEVTRARGVWRLSASEGKALRLHPIESSPTRGGFGGTKVPPNSQNYQVDNFAQH